MDFGGFKLLVEAYTGLEKDALHIHAALLLYLVAICVLRGSRKLLISWLLVLGVELANEAYDLWKQTTFSEPVRWGDGLRDLWNTMLWPTVLLLIGRYTKLFVPKSGTAGSGEGETK